MTKELSHVMLELHNVTIEPSNVRKKNKETTKCNKKTVTCEVEIAHGDDRIIKCEKKVRELPDVTKKLSHFMLELYNMKIKRSNVRKKIS